MTGERVTVDMPLSELEDIEEIRADLRLAPWVDLEDLPMRKAAALLWASRPVGAERRQELRHTPLVSFPVTFSTLLRRAYRWVSRS